MIRMLGSAVAVAALVVCAPWPVLAQDTAAQAAANKQLLLDFFAFQGTRDERVQQFLADDYTQHNPRFLAMDKFTGAKGGEAWARAGEEANRRGIRLVELNGIALRNPIILMAEGDLVTAIYRGTQADPDGSGRMWEIFAFETFRVRNGKFVEHWDQVTLAPGWMDPQ